MTRRMASFLLSAALVSGCGRSQPAQRKDQNYQVVQEGQASGVTSTINGPGETTPPMTNTGVDTTTNLTLLDNPAPLGTQGTSNIAGTLPTTTATPPRTVPTSTLPPMTSATPSAPTTTGTVTSSQPQPQQQPQRRKTTRPPQTDTTATQAPPPTDTTATQAPPPPPTDTTKTDTTKTDTTKTDTTKTDTTSTEKPPV